jgi:PAS domain S-box-containing protein
VTFDTIDDPVLLVDDQGMVRRLNEPARELAGLNLRDVLGRRVGSIGDSPLWQHADEVVESSRRAGRPTSTQVTGNGNGETWVVKANPVRAGDVDRGSVIVIAHDVTPLVRLQDSLRRSETMAAMGSLVAGVAHEVRNPLFSMTATLDVLEMRYGFREKTRKHVEVFRSQLERMKQLMQELLDYGKPPTLDLECLALEPVIKEAIEAHRQLAEEQTVRLHIECEVGLPPIHMDRARLVQVFDNLVANAIQFTGIGGIVSVKARLIRQDGRDWIESTVADTGAGFAPADVDHVFDPFFTRRPGGTGLGLALVQRIVEQHGGSIRAENGRQAGAAVRVRLPLLVNDVPVST